MSNGPEREWIKMQKSANIPVIGDSRGANPSIGDRFNDDKVNGGTSRPAPIDREPQGTPAPPPPKSKE